MSNSAPLRVLIVDDSTLVREGLRAVLASQPGERKIEVVGDAASVATGVEAARKLGPDVVLMDIRLPDGSGLDACRQILAHSPEQRILILTSVVDDQLVLEAIRAGAHGYLLKEIDTRGLVSALIDVSAGKSILDPAVTARVMQLAKTNDNRSDALASLSPQEKRIVALIAEGCTNKEAAQRLGLSEKTVKNYLSTAFEKLHVTSRAHAAALYVQSQKPA
jgi:two-component system response regulator DevR